MNTWIGLLVVLTGISPVILVWLVTRTNHVKEKLEEIEKLSKSTHTLVNSNLTAAIQGEFDAITRELAMMREIVDLKQRSGHEVSTDALEAIGVTEAKLKSLHVILTDRKLV